MAFEKSNGYKEDPTAFLFSLTEGLKCIQRDDYNKRYSIYDATSNLPTFGGGHDLKIMPLGNEKLNSYSNFGYTYKCEGIDYSSSGAQSFLGGAY